MPDQSRPWLFCSLPLIRYVLAGVFVHVQTAKDTWRVVAGTGGLPHDF